MDVAALVQVLSSQGLERGALVAVAFDREGGIGLATLAGSWSSPGPEPWRAVKALEGVIRPRWVMWSATTAHALVGEGVRVATAWDIAAVHRLIFGGWEAGPALVWAALKGLDLGALPTGAPADLFSLVDGGGGDLDDPVRPDGYLRPEWEAGWWRASPKRARRWAELAARVAVLQADRLAALPQRPMAVATARCESAAELLCAEMTADGLPVDRAEAERIIAGFIGPRPGTAAEAAESCARRDAVVLHHLGPGAEVDLRSTAQVKEMLAQVGVEVADTRAWRLQAVAGQHPVVGALLAWRKAERISTTYGYTWLDHHVGNDGRLRGTWTSCDGAAGRMTASSGLHSLPAELRPAVMAEPGYVFVRGDLGQIEPRVLAVVSGDQALAEAATGEDLYLPVAAQLGLDRPTAKVAVLGAMYGQTTGHGAQARQRLVASYPVAMAYLERAARAAEAGRDIRTFGGRLVRMSPLPSAVPGPPQSRAVSAARGRYGRNAVVQGAAAELFKTWAVTVRARAGDLGARIVLCLHDELLVHTPQDGAGAVAQLLSDCLGEAARRWSPGTPVVFPVDISVLHQWSEAKPGPVPPGDGPVGS